MTEFFTKTAFVVAASLLASTAHAQEVTLRFQHFVSPNSANPKHFITPWAEKVEAESNGRIKVEIYPFMELGGTAPEQYDLIADGVVDGGWVIPGYQAGRFPETETLELPFISTKSAENSSRAAWEFTQKYLTDDFADVHLIAAHVHGPGIVHKKGAALEKAQDLAGLKLRGPSRPATLLLDQLGAEPIGMPVPQFPESLAKGVVDGGVIPWEIAPSLKLDELTDSHTDVAGDHALYNLYFIWAMNKDVYESLPDDLRAVIDANSGLETSAWAGRALDIGDAEGKAVIEQTDNQIATLSESETAIIRAAGDQVISNWISEMEGNGLPGTQLVDDARAMIAKATEEAAN
ncbi:MAG: TRAP transporter substrate-binding protein [Pelagimonas sp.]|jgi:TRAP-type C4-dicarboxylate transport system substrate-binding protein|nr:TRAP transporter substrate-binding protein [Pelagimonas sp.]